MANLASQLILSIVDRATAPARGIASAMDNMRGRIERNNQQMRAMQGQLMGAAVGAVALAKAVAAPVNAAAEFESAMNQVAAVSGATSDQLGGLADLAKEMGATTQFSASQAAEAMNFLS